MLKKKVSILLQKWKEKVEQVEAVWGVLCHGVRVLRRSFASRNGLALSLLEKFR